MDNVRFLNFDSTFFTFRIFHRRPTGPLYKGQGFNSCTQEETFYPGNWPLSYGEPEEEQTPIRCPRYVIRVRGIVGATHDGGAPPF